MIGIFTERVRKIMGWCPQKDFGFMQAGDTKYKTDMHDFCTGYGDTQKKWREKVLVDVPVLDSGMIRILIPVWIVGFMLMIIVNHYSILDIFIVLAYYLAVLLWVLQNRTTVELTYGTIIIHRPFLRSIVIQKNEITKSQVMKNLSHRKRWILRLVEIIILIFVASHNLNAIRINIEQSLPILVTMVNIFYIPLITVWLAVLFFNNEIRMHYEASLHVAINKRQFMFYVDNPDEFSLMLQHTGDGTRKC
ncbi:MAG: hypothetical protein SCH39_05705 [Methanosarcinales archaeon]|nr:hypothetical protein [Methanosarcinales archaeon]